MVVRRSIYSGQCYILKWNPESTLPVPTSPKVNMEGDGVRAHPSNKSSTKSENHIAEAEK